MGLGYIFFGLLAEEKVGVACSVHHARSCIRPRAMLANVLPHASFAGVASHYAHKHRV